MQRSILNPGSPSCTKSAILEKPPAEEGAEQCSYIVWTLCRPPWYWCSELKYAAWADNTVSDQGSLSPRRVQSSLVINSVHHRNSSITLMVWEEEEEGECYVFVTHELSEEASMKSKIDTPLIYSVTQLRLAKILVTVSNWISCHGSWLWEGWHWNWLSVGLFCKTPSLSEELFSYLTLAIDNTKESIVGLGIYLSDTHMVRWRACF